MLQYRAEPSSSNHSSNNIKLSSSIKILYLCMDKTCNIRFLPFNYNITDNHIVACYIPDIISEYYITSILIIEIFKILKTNHFSNIVGIVLHRGSGSKNKPLMIALITKSTLRMKKSERGITTKF
jgi:hypothetical protein